MTSPLTLFDKLWIRHEIVQRDGESLLWVDLAMERPVVLPEGRPAEIELAAFANLERLQRCVRRAHDLQLRLWDGADALIRTIARRGLIAQIRRDGDATVLDITGPLALPHAAIVYGRALAAVVPLLAEPPRFELDLLCRFGGLDVALEVAPPLWLPAAAAAPHPPTSPAQRLADDLAMLGHAVDREPPPIAAGDRVLLPDLVVDRRGARWLVEVLGFATRESIADKLARYRAAGFTRVVLCADLATAPGCDLEPGVCGFLRCVEVDELFAAMGEPP